MPRFIEPLWLIFVSLANKEAAKIITFKNKEIEVLKSKLPKRITTTKQERNSLLKIGRDIGIKLVCKIISIVDESTFRRWDKEARCGKVAIVKKREPGRPRTPIEICTLVLEMANHNRWGFSKILGELKKLKM